MGSKMHLHRSQIRRICSINVQGNLLQLLRQGVLDFATCSTMLGQSSPEIKQLPSHRSREYMPDGLRDKHWWWWQFCGFFPRGSVIWSYAAKQLELQLMEMASIKEARNTLPGKHREKIEWWMMNDEYHKSHSKAINQSINWNQAILIFNNRDLHRSQWIGSGHGASFCFFWHLSLLASCDWVEEARRRSRWNLRFSAHINAGYNGLLAPKKKSQETWISRWFVDELFSKLGTPEPKTSSGTTQDWAQLIMVVSGWSWCFPAAPCCWCRDWDESRRFDTQLGILASLAVELEKPKKLSCDVQAQTCFLSHLGPDVFLEGWNDSKSADIRQLRQLPVKRNPASQSLSCSWKQCEIKRGRRFESVKAGFVPEMIVCCWLCQKSPFFRNFELRWQPLGLLEPWLFSKLLRDYFR